MAEALDMDALYRQHHGMVRRRVRRFVDEDQVADLVQQVFERALRHADGFEGRSSIVTWLYQVATRVCLHHLRDTRRRAELLQTWGTPAWSRPGMRVDPEARVFLGQLWRTLDAGLVEIGTYHYIDGMTQAEIAQVVGVSRRTVGNRLAELQATAQAAAAPAEDSP